MQTPSHMLRSELMLTASTSDGKKLGSMARTQSAKGLVDHSQKASSSSYHNLIR
jgi:hypothetical protein